MVDSFYVFGCLFYLQEEKNLKSGSFCILQYKLRQSIKRLNIHNSIEYIVAKRKFRLILFDQLTGSGRKKLTFTKSEAQFLLFFHSYFFPHVFFNCKFYVNFYGKGSALNVYDIVLHFRLSTISSTMTCAGP